MVDDANVIIAGGSDSMSNGELPMPRQFTQAMALYQRGGGNKKGLQGIRDFLDEAGPISSWGPQAPPIGERSTGRTMGFHADLMAEINSIRREDQDQLAMNSHKNAHAATVSGKMKEEIVPVKTKRGKVVSQDDMIRSKQDPAKVCFLASLLWHSALPIS